MYQYENSLLTNTRKGFPTTLPVNECAGWFSRFFALWIFTFYNFIFVNLSALNAIDRVCVVLRTGILKNEESITKRHNTFLYKINHSLFLKRVEIHCKHVGVETEAKTRTQTGGGLLYWPFLNPRVDSIFRDLRLCFLDERFSTGFRLAFAGCSPNLLTARLIDWLWLTAVTSIYIIS